jgi:hypothetical protein
MSAQQELLLLLDPVHTTAKQGPGLHLNLSGQQESCAGLDGSTTGARAAPECVYSKEAFAASGRVNKTGS